MFGFSLKRSGVEKRQDAVVDNALANLGYGPDSDTVVSESTALSIPAVADGIGFISSTIASLPIRLYKVKPRTGTKTLVTGTAMSRMVGTSPSDGVTKYNYLNHLYSGVLLGGRGYSLLVRNERDQVIEIRPMDRHAVQPERSKGKLQYRLTVGNEVTIIQPRDIIDIPWRLESDFLSHYQPVARHRDALALGLVLNTFSTQHYKNSGLPPFTLTGKFGSGAAIEAAALDVMNAIRKVVKKGSLVLPLPIGHEIKTLNPNSQTDAVLGLQKFFILQVARIWGLPPMYLASDLTTGSYSNSEQADLQLSKHTLRRWIEQLEGEMNLKLWPRGDYCIELPLSSIQRGDFLSRIRGLAVGIHSGQLTPNEARYEEGRPPSDQPNANELMIQGATIPIGDLGTTDPANA